MKKILIMTVLAVFSFATKASTELVKVNLYPSLTFNGVASAIRHGRPLSFVILLKHCKANHGLHQKDLIFSVQPSSALLIKNEKITASYLHFTLNEPEFEGLPIYDYSKYNLYPDGKVTIQITLMNAIDYSKVKNFELHCQMPLGFRVYSHKFKQINRINNSLQQLIEPNVRY